MENEDVAILKHFDSVFETKTVNHIKLNMPLLKVLLNHFIEEIYKPSEKYIKLLSKNNIQIDNLMETLTKEQKQLLEKCLETTYMLLVEQDEQAFLFGYILAKELEIEGDSKNG